MEITCVKEFDLGVELGQVRSVPVQLGDQEGILFVYSSCPNIDPGEELLQLPNDTLKLSMFTMDGKRLWTKELGKGVLPGIWFAPVLAFDLDCDGVDEIYFINNKSTAPFSMDFRRLTALNALTGETLGEWKWPKHTFYERLSHCYRYYLIAGYANGEPVLMTSQGTYGDMFLQGYSKGMVKRWETVIKDSDPGPRASHMTPVLDFNQDGVDELFWGERLLSVDTGKEVMNFDNSYHGHSDFVVPFEDYQSGKRYLFTCREDGESEGKKRIYTFNEDGSVAWAQMDHGHMHNAWVANILDGYRKMVMCMRVEYRPDEENDRYVHAYDGEWYFDAFTGEPLPWDFPIRGSDLKPIDIDGDGYHEFLCVSGDHKGTFYDRHGNVLGMLKGSQNVMRTGKLDQTLQGEQLMLWYPKEGKVKIWADKEAKDSEIIRQRYRDGYLHFMQKLTASGYNAGFGISMGI